MKRSFSIKQARQSFHTRQVPIMDISSIPIVRENPINPTPIKEKSYIVYIDGKWKFQ